MPRFVRLSIQKREKRGNKKKDKAKDKQNILAHRKSHDPRPCMIALESSK